MTTDLNLQNDVFWWELDVAAGSYINIKYTPMWSIHQYLFFTEHPVNVWCNSWALYHLSFSCFITLWGRPCDYSNIVTVFIFFKHWTNGTCWMMKVIFWNQLYHISFTALLLHFFRAVWLQTAAIRLLQILHQSGREYILQLSKYTWNKPLDRIGPGLR